MPGRTQRKVVNTLNSQKLADFKVGVDNVIFSVDSSQNQLLVLLVMRHQDPFLNQWSLPGAKGNNTNTVTASPAAQKR